MEQLQTTITVDPFFSIFAISDWQGIPGTDICCVLSITLPKPEEGKCYDEGEVDELKEMFTECISQFLGKRREQVDVRVTTEMKLTSSKSRA